MIKKFSDIVLKNDGKIIGARFNKEYFSRHNLLELWNEFEQNTTHLSYLDNIIHSFKFLQAGFVTSETIPKCHCGEHVKFMNGGVSTSCSKKCALSSPLRAEKIKLGCASADKEQSKISRKTTMIEKYGVEFNSQRDDIHDRWTKTKLKEETFARLNDRDWLDNEYNTKTRTSVDIAQELNCYYSTVLWYCRKHGFKIRRTSKYSLEEIEIIRYIESLGATPHHSDWDLLEDVEIDIVVEDKKFAIEMDGLHWHSIGKGEETKENRERHLSKTNRMKELGYELLHITDSEWHNKNSIVKNMIRSKLCLNDRIYARNCLLKQVETKEVKPFLSENHVQGYSTSKINYGLYFKDELVMLATFGKPRFNKEYDWELIRLSTKQGLSVVGGMSRLITQFRKNNVGSLISYCDKRYGYGNSYLKCGFSNIGETSPGYTWTDGTNMINRFKTQKANLVKWLPSFDPSLSESDNMFNAGYKRFWDCGQLKFVM